MKLISKIKTENDGIFSKHGAAVPNQKSGKSVYKNLNIYVLA